MGLRNKSDTLKLGDIKTDRAVQTKAVWSDALVKGWIDKWKGVKCLINYLR